MEANLYLVFIGVSTAVIVIPGPSVLLIVSNSLQRGLVAGLTTAIGVSASMLVQLAIALVGLTSLVTMLSRALGVVRWFGIAYLCYLGIRRWLATVPVGRFATSEAPREGSAFAQGFLVALTNPTTMLFFVAFFPQFLHEEAPPESQLLLMAATFWVLALVFDIAYAALSARIGEALQDPKSAVVRNRLSGAIMIAAAAALALARI